ncbi:velvet factor-domain-containing protein [Russula compacta]|nr:velvet factor-domain-containing protein [Russula compacta]
MYPFPPSHPHFQHPESFPQQPSQQQQPQQPQQQPQQPQPQPQPAPAPAPSSSSSQQVRERDQSRDPSHPAPHRAIGAPLNFSTGQFAGKHVRAELIELQKADLGRKYARKDRRPLDPPPVVQLKFFYSYPGTDRPDSEVDNYDEVNNMGLICHVDLFPVPPGDSSDVSADAKRRQDQAQSSPGRASTSTLSRHPTLPPPPPYSPQHGAPPANISSAHANSISTQQQAQAQEHPYPPNQPPSNPTRPEEIVHYFNGTFPISEGSKQTDALAGTTFVQAANLDYKGNKVLMFVFADLAVKAEGNFILRYRCFDLFSRVAASDGQTPVWAECYGGPFRVYSTKEFPGLRASTDLTKHLSYFGVRLNLRETERKRRKKIDDPSQSVSAVSAGAGSVGSGTSKGKRRDEEESGYDD